MNDKQWTPEQIKKIRGREAREPTDPKLYERKLVRISDRVNEDGSREESFLVTGGSMKDS